MKKAILLFTAAFMLFSPAPASAGFDFKTIDYKNLFAERTVRGYVCVARQTPAYFGSTPTITELNRWEMYDALLSGLRDTVPFTGATVAFEGSQNSAAVDEHGYFELKTTFGERIWNKRLLCTTPAGEALPGLDGVLDRQREPFILITVDKRGKLSVACLKAGELAAQTRQAVLLLHGFGLEGGFFGPRNSAKRWDRIRDLLVSDSVMDPYAVFILNYPLSQDIVPSSRDLARAVKAARMLTGQPVILVGFSMGGLVCRHYTVSTWYEPGAISRMLLVGTPNRGTNKAILVLSTSDGNRQALRQLLAGSELIRALNSEAARDTMDKLHIQGSLMDQRGLNPAIPCAVIAGDVVGPSIKKMRNAGMHIATTSEIVFDSLLEVLRRDFNIAIDSELFKNALNDLLAPLIEISASSPGVLSGSDMVVDLESALISGVPHRVIPFAHWAFLDATGHNDIRYTLVRDFIVSGPNAITE